MDTMRAVLLDVDGTLLDSNDAHASAWSEAAREFGFPRPSSFFTPLMGMGGDRVLPLIDTSLTDVSGTGKEIAELCRSIYEMKYFPTVAATRGARSLVRRFHDEGRTCIIATSGSPKEVAASLERLEIAAYIDHSSSSENADASKPEPGIVRAALRKANVASKDALLLGDTQYDVEAAAAADVRAVELRTGGRTDDELRGAVSIFDDPQDMLDRFDWTPPVR